jgi:transposase
VICDQAIRLNGFYVSKDYPNICGASDSRTGVWQDTGVLTNNTALPPLTIAALYKSRWQVELFFKWIKQHLRIKRFSGHERERGEDANLVRRLHLRADRHRQKGASPRCLALYFATDSVGLGFRENRDFMRLAARWPAA